MICPNCKKDYKDVREGQIPGFVVRVDDNFGMNFKRFGMACTSCGFISEWVAKSTGSAFMKRVPSEIEVSKKITKRKWGSRKLKKRKQLLYSDGATR